MCLVKNMRTEDKVYHVAVIGGGASGMMAAIAAARRQASVLLLEQNDQGRNCFPPEMENVIIPMRDRGFPFTGEITLLL